MMEGVNLKSPAVGSSTRSAPAAAAKEWRTRGRLFPNAGVGCWFHQLTPNDLADRSLHCAVLLSSALKR
jgi:hypothetical protein